MNRSKSALGSIPLGPIYANGGRDTDAPDSLTLMASTPLLRPRNELSYESVVIRACGGSDSQAPLMSYLDLESRLGAAANDKVSAKALAEMENIFCGSAREVVLHLSMMVPERARLTERMFAFYASLFPRLLPTITCLEQETSRLRIIVDRETDQRTRVGKIITDWCGNSNAGSTEQRLRKGMLKALASCDEGKEDKGGRGNWAPITEYLFRQSQSLVKELDFANNELAAAIPPAKLEAAHQANSDAEKRCKDAQEKLQEEQKAHAETRHQNMLRLSEMTEEWNTKFQDSSQEVAQLRLKFEAEMLENESKARTRSEDLSRRLAAETQSSEQKIAETAALQSKLLLAESQLTENAQKVRSLECQHLETMRSTQAALLEAQSELQEFVQMGEKLHAMRCQMMAQTSRVLDLVNCSDNSSAAGDQLSLESPAQEGDACVSAFSQLQAALERLMLMTCDLVAQGKEDTTRILKMDGDIKNSRAVIEGLREEVRHSIPRKPNTDMFTQTITVTSSAFSQTEPSSDDTASRRTTPPIVLSKPPSEMETLSQFLSKYMRKRFGLVEPQADWEVQRLSKELGQELFGQHVKSFEASTLT